MNSKVFCSAVLFIIFICIVTNLGNNKNIYNKIISLLLLLAIIATILSASKSNANLESFVDESTAQEETAKALDLLVNERKNLDLSEMEVCKDRRIVSLGSGYHPLKDVPACVDNASMFIFSSGKCSPKCCDFGKTNGFSCSNGCICKE